MATLARAEAEAPRWFTRLPRAGCAAVAVDAGPLAYYTGPSPDGARGGTFFFKTADPSAWTRYQLEVTTFHGRYPATTSSWPSPRSSISTRSSASSR